MGTNVLRNVPNIRDPEKLAVYEADSTTARLAELFLSPMPGRFDVGHLRAIHQYIFQDVFSWAGKFRTVNISKGGNFFGAAAFVEPALAGVLQELPAENYLRQISAPRFDVRAGYYLSEINAIHPFREGNGRTQREFIRELGVEAGFLVDWRRTSRDQMIEVSRVTFRTGDSSEMAALIQACLH